MQPQDTPDERWLPVVGWEQSHRISSTGSVWSAHRGGRVLASWLNCHGYPLITLQFQGRKRHRTVYSLVAAAFIGPRPDGYEIDHLDNDPSNSRAANLEYVTRAENMNRLFMRRGGRQPNAKLAPADVQFLRTPEGRKARVSELVARFHVSRDTIITVRRGGNWPEIS